MAHSWVDQKFCQCGATQHVVDAAAATATAERLITSDGVSAIMGADCSGVTTAVLQNVATAKGIVMISPSATSCFPALSTIEDNGLFFRTSPSDARQGQVLAEILKEKNVKSAAMSYTNNDYGKGLVIVFKRILKRSAGESLFLHRTRMAKVTMVLKWQRLLKRAVMFLSLLDT